MDLGKPIKLLTADPVRRRRSIVADELARDPTGGSSQRFPQCAIDLYRRIRKKQGREAHVECRWCESRGSPIEHRGAPVCVDDDIQWMEITVTDDLACRRRLRTKHASRHASKICVVSRVRCSLNVTQEVVEIKRPLRPLNKFCTQ